MEQIGNKIKKLRSDHKMNQEEFANHVGISRSNISKWESGQLVPSIEMLDTIAKIFDKKVDYFLGKIESTDKENIKVNPPRYNNIQASGVKIQTSDIQTSSAHNGKFTSKPSWSKSRKVWLAISLTCLLLVIIGIILMLIPILNPPATGLRIKHMLLISIGFLLFGGGFGLGLHALLRAKRW